MSCSPNHFCLHLQSVMGKEVEIDERAGASFLSAKLKIGGRAVWYCPFCGNSLAFLLAPGTARPTLPAATVASASAN